MTKYELEEKTIEAFSIWRKISGGRAVRQITSNGWSKIDTNKPMLGVRSDTWGTDYIIIGHNLKDFERISWGLLFVEICKELGINAQWSGEYHDSIELKA